MMDIARRGNRFPKEFLKNGRIGAQKLPCRLIVFVCLLMSSPAMAASSNYNPFIGVNTGYDDNVLFNRTAPIEDYYLTVTPGINIDIASDRYELDINSFMQILRYGKEKDLDSEYYKFETEGEYRLTQRLTFGGETSYLKDTTLDSEIEETGRILNRTDRERYTGGGNLSYQWNELSRVNFRYSFTRTEYESNDNVDRDRHRFQFDYNRWFDDRTEKLIIRPAYSRGSTEDDQKVDYYRITAGWTHIFNKTITSEVLLGYGYVVDSENGDETTNHSWNADLSLTKNSEILSIKIGFRSNARIDTEGNLWEVDRFYGSLDKMLSPRLRSKINGSVYFSRPLGGFNDYDSVYYNFNPLLEYYITERYTFYLSYRYSMENDKTLSDDQRRTRNSIAIGLNFQF